jgi:uncharacterized protein YdhG (YjbR/CyaY superfamily)
MKKAKSSKRDSGARRKGPPKSVEEYLARVSEPARGTLKKLRAIIRTAVPREATEVISYGIPMFKYKGALVWFAAFSDHCSLFPTAAIIEKFKNDLRGYKTSKRTIHFPLDKPPPAVLIKKIVRTRAAQIENNKRN